MFEDLEPRPQRGEPLRALSREDLDVYAVEDLQGENEDLRSEVDDLRERVAARDFDQIAAEIFQLRENICKRNPRSARESVSRIAPNAAHRAAGQTDKRARSPGVRRFALNREENFGDS